MKRILPVAALAAAALAAAACEKPGSRTAYINSGASATAAMPATSEPSKPATEFSPQDTLGPAADAPRREGSTSAATSDTASPSPAVPSK